MRERKKDERKKEEEEKKKKREEVERKMKDVKCRIYRVADIFKEA